MKKTAKLLFLGLIAFQWVAGAWLGITVRDLSPELAARYGIHRSVGVLVSGVHLNSPAMTAGLREGDLLLSLNDEKISDTKALKQLITRLSAGLEIEILVLRNQQKVNIHLVLGRSPRDQA
ncbi:MAG: PDZ domain-containing protein [Nitrospirae bacterium]|nr:PDZ domain-containing protein [Candidatus Manganitrophaceae bacterium]